MTRGWKNEEVVTATFKDYSEERNWIFEYGSLIWKLGLEHGEERMAIAWPWQRSSFLKTNGEEQRSNPT
jgi:cation transport regulator ChaC